MTLLEQFEEEYCERPTEPFASDEEPEQWCKISFWQERYTEWLEVKLNSISEILQEDGERCQLK